MPYPSRPGPNSAGTAGQVVSPGAGSPAYAGAGMRAAGAGMRAAGTAALPSAGMGSVSPTPTAATSGGGFPVAGMLATAASVAPPPIAGSGEAGSPGTSSGLPFNAGTDPARNNVGPGALCARLAVIQCAAEAHCCFAPTRTTSQCETASAAACREQLFLDQIAQNPITGFDPNFTAQVFMELEDRSRNCDLGIAAWTVTPQGLRGILRGTRGPDTSCKPPATALMDKPSQAAALASCTNLESHACLPKSLLGDWTCAVKSGSGANCITDDNCQADMYCRNPQMNPLGKCALRAALGASCSTGNECQSMFCKSGACVAAEQQLAFCGE